MKKLITKHILFLLLMLSFTSCSVFKKNPKLICGNDIDYISKEQGQFDKNGNKTGKWKEYHENGYLKSVGNYVNGNREGEWNFFYDNGEELNVEYYKNGKHSNGTEKANGQLEKTGSYKNDKKTGEWKHYDQQGNLIKTENY